MQRRKSFGSETEYCIICTVLASIAFCKKSLTDYKTINTEYGCRTCWAITAKQFQNYGTQTENWRAELSAWVDIYQHIFTVPWKIRPFGITQELQLFAYASGWILLMGIKFSTDAEACSNL